MPLQFPDNRRSDFPVGSFGYETGESKVLPSLFPVFVIAASLVKSKGL